MGMNFNRLRKNKDAVMRGAALFLLDIFLIACCMVGALWLRYDFQLSNIDPFFWQSIVEYLPINIYCGVPADQHHMHGDHQPDLPAVYQSLEICQHCRTEKCSVRSIYIIPHPVDRDEDPGPAGAQKLYFYLYYAAGRMCDHPQICLPVYPDYVEQPQIRFQDQS